MKKIYNIKVNNKVYEVELEEVKEVEGRVVKESSSDKVVLSGSVDGVSVKAPMPGTIINVKCSVGDNVKEGQVVAILEAMKMETEILSSSSGTVTSIGVEKGGQVNLDDVILTIK